MKITIFGSCRQYPIKDEYEVTNIQEFLTYPHYSNEILQAINYCKFDNYIDVNHTKYCFRNGLLFNQNIDYNFKKDFENTDIFILEIASRISYKWNDIYLHHISTDKKYNFPYINDIKIEDETDNEIEENILSIQKLLYPKPFIIISHFCTYNHGKRFELTKLLEKITTKYNIPFLNPSILLYKYTKDQLFVNEKNISHYTDFGKNIIKQEYIKIINNLYENKNDTKNIY